MNREEAETTLMNAAAEVFEIIPSYFEEDQAKQVAAVMATLILQLCPQAEKSPEVREMLESYPYKRKTYL